VFVDGQIDRVDLSADGVRVRVIDYKTGRPPEGDARRMALQLPLYAAAAARALGAAHIEAMFVRVTARGMIEESPKRPADRLVKPEELVERCREARRAVRTMWEGRVAPRPAFLALCARCDARDLCRRPAVMPIEEPEDRA
jgi:ATP-dependent helicase/nuclease subunit B